MASLEDAPPPSPAEPQDDALRAEHYRRQLENVANNATLALFIMDEHQHCTYMNPAAERLTGFTLAEVRGRALHDVIHHTRPDGTHYPLEECPIDQAFPQNMREQGEEVFVHRDGHFYPVAFTASPVLEGGRPVGTIIEVRDITEERRADAERERLIGAERRAREDRERLVRELEVERARLFTVFRQAPAFIATVRGPEHVFEMANPPYYQLVGHRDILGKPAREALPELEGQGFFRLLDHVYRTGEPFVGTELPIRLQREPGAEPEERFLNFVYQPLAEADGSVSGILAHGVDVTEQVRSREEAEEASRAKSDFLATMSHELRTPLNAMIGYAQLLEMGVPEPIGERALQHVERIRLSARHLLELIEEILTFSRIEAGRERVEPEPVWLRELADEVYAIVEPLAAQKKLAFRVEVPDPSVTLETDPRKVRQILLNLLGNAVKFTARGEVVFRAWRSGAEVVLEVRDTGIGIVPEHLEKVFEPFWQAESAMHVRTEGTGLGLPVTRRLAELLGGSVAVQSTPGEGTTFRVVLPARYAPPEESGG